MPPYPGDMPPGVRGEATRAGWRAAHEGQYDEWSFADAARLPYLQELDHRRRQAVAQENDRTAAAASAIVPENQSQRRTENIARRYTAELVDVLRRRRDKARLQEDKTLAGLDVLAGVRGPLVRRDWDDDLEWESTPDDATATDEPVEERPRTVGWMGPAGGHLAPPMPRWLKLFIMVALCAVEIPIYLEIFRYFHARSELLLWSFTLPVAFGMIVAPHLSGVWWRKRHTLPYERILLFLVPAVLVIWTASAVLLGYLRQKALLTPQIDPETNENVGGAQALGINPWTVTALFTFILLLSGLIAVMLGLAEDHPGVAAYRAAGETREAAEDAYLEAVREQAGTEHSTVVGEDERRQELSIRSSERATAISAEFEAAKAAYLDSIALGLARPAVTEAAGQSLPPVSVPRVPDPR
ncbi:hypothetical protein Q0Z83_045550 [Actinoplanes sichuanensis]|nr:hypothetical protein Q0Z83_045550 [Actinoplanes sichuanensis]